MGIGPFRNKSKDLPPALKGRKVSEVFLEFANPMLRQIMTENPNLTAKDCEFHLRVPWMAWNAVVMKEKKSLKMDPLAMMSASLKNAPVEAKAIVESLVARKIKHFSEYTYAIGKLEVRSIGNGNIHIYAEAKSIE